MSDLNAIRESFESWAETEGLNLCRHLQSLHYKESNTYYAWKAWQVQDARAPSAPSAGVDEVARDATRYRWLRDARVNPYAVLPVREFLDGYVDAAIQSAARGDGS